MNIDALIQTIALAAIPVLFAITMHEAAHAYAAYHFGDMTAYSQGKVTLNPLKHVDPIGTVLVPLVTLLAGGFLFGWASTPINFAALRRPKQDMLWVALAGPAANLVMALFWGLMIKLALMNPTNYFAEPLIGMAEIGVTINAILLVLNLLPLPPLDGGRIAVSLLPYRQAYRLSKIEPYGMVILILLAVVPVGGSPILSWILSPLAGAVIRTIETIF
ncbi:MAG: site-2 protease family protein [Nitrosomonadales bacterium]|nr:site-2 protease family protein [Nitrosomonadales bacterium]